MQRVFCNSSYLAEADFYTVTETSWLREVRELDSEVVAFLALSPPTRPQWRGDTWAKLVSVLFLVTLATVGNVMVILSVVMNKAMRTTINFYLVNLTVADLMVTAWGPFHSLMREMGRQGDGEGQYILPAIFCKLSSFYSVVCVVSSVLTLSAISCDRFMAVFCPLRARVTQRKARYFIVFVWSLAVVVASPFLVVSTIVEFRYSPLSYSSASCHETFPTFSSCDTETSTVLHSHVAKKAYYSLVNIVMFLVPGLFMTLCYSLIVTKLYCSSAPGERLGLPAPQSRAKRKVVKLVLVVIAAFFLCWSPHQLLMAHAIFSTDSQLTRNTFWIHMFAYSHAMINPMIYITFNENFKKSFKRFVFCSKEEIPCEHSSSFQRQFSWKFSFSRRTIENGRNIEIRCAAALLGPNLYNPNRASVSSNLYNSNRASVGSNLYNSNRASDGSNLYNINVPNEASKWEAETKFDQDYGNSSCRLVRRLN